MDLPQVHHLSEITTTARLHWVARDVDTSYLSARRAAAHSSPEEGRWTSFIPQNIKLSNRTLCVQYR
jgi:hypothetical protein